MNITRGKKQEAQKVVVYGPEGIGKSTFASQFPDPLFIDTEGSTSNMDVARLDPPSSFTMLMEEICYVKLHPEVCRTLVLDTADWAEQLCIAEFCSKKQISGIEDIGYGKGYVYIAEEFGRMLNLLEEVKKQGINIVVTAHAQMRKFEQPDEMGSYDRWELKLQKKDAPLLKEWADMVLFVNYKTIVVNVDNQGAAKGKNKAQGGKRVMYTEHHPCWDAKNRHGLAGEVAFAFSAIADCIPVAGKAAGAAEAGHKAVEYEAAPVSSPTMSTVPAEDALADDPGVSDAMPEYCEAPAKAPEGKDEIPQKLLDLMKMNRVELEDVMRAVESRGYYPKGTPFSSYDPAFVDGVLVGAWPQVYEMIRKNKMDAGEFMNIPDGVQEELPFN